MPPDRRRKRSVAAVSETARAGAPEAASPAPPAWRDPLLWLSALAALVLLATSAGAPLGEPVADDYEYLHHMRFTPHWGWLDGFGSQLYWRPLARQAYYGALYGTLLSSPFTVALLHLACLALAGALLYRALRPALGSWPAFAAATFVPFMESSRMLIAWPSNFQDVGCILFVALALHEAVARRLATFLAAALASFLCKEVGVVGAALVLVCPAVRFRDLRERLRWIAAFAVLVAAWGALYRWVWVHAPLVPPGATEIELAARSEPLLHRVTVVAGWGVRALLSLPPIATKRDAPAFLAAGLLAVAWLVTLVVKRGAASRSRATWPWLAWGGAWCVALGLTLVPFYPGWGAYRMAFVGLGAGVAIPVLLAATDRSLLFGWLALRLALTAVGPPPSRDVTSEVPAWGASIDIPRLTRLQRFVIDVRAALAERYPTLPPGSAVVQRNFARLTEFAFGNKPALHVWYGDSTLRWVRFTEWRKDASRPVTTVVEYENGRADEVALVEPGALRALLAALDALNAGDVPAGLAALARAESLQLDSNAVVFRGEVLGKRAYALATLGEFDAAEAAARRALALYAPELDGRFTLARVHALRGEWAESKRQLEILLSYQPGDPPALAALASVDSAMRAEAGR